MVLIYLSEFFTSDIENDINIKQAFHNFARDKVKESYIVPYKLQPAWKVNAERELTRMWILFAPSV